MGNDGGTIAKRQDILSLHSYGKNGESEKVQIVEDESSDLTVCALSSAPLYGPENPVIVSDYKGKLYDKQEVLKYMLKQKGSKKDLIEVKDNGLNKIPSQFSHLRSLGDIIDVHVNWKLESPGVRPNIECPVTKELNSNTVYAYLRPCGCVLSYKILEGFDKYFSEKDNKSDNSQKDFDCPNCGELFNFKYDVVILNPRDIEERAEFNKRSFDFLQELQLTHSKKPIKMKKKKKDKSESKGPSESKRRAEVVDGATNVKKKTKF